MLAFGSARRASALMFCGLVVAQAALGDDLPISLRGHSVELSWTSDQTMRLSGSRAGTDLTPQITTIIRFFVSSQGRVFNS
jgi:hypothetical protein